MKVGYNAFALGRRKSCDTTRSKSIVAQGDRYVYGVHCSLISSSTQLWSTRFIPTKKSWAWRQWPPRRGLGRGFIAALLCCTCGGVALSVVTTGRSGVNGPGTVRLLPALHLRPTGEISRWVPRDRSLSVCSCCYPDSDLYTAIRGSKWPSVRFSLFTVTSTVNPDTEIICRRSI